MYSLRQQVLVRVLGSFVLALLVMLYVSYQQALHEIEEIFDAELAQTAQMIGKLALANIDSKGEEVAIGEAGDDAISHKYEKHISYQVWYRDVLVLKSSSAPDEPLAQEESYSNIEQAGRQWRVFGLYPQGSPYRIYTAEDNEARDELSWQFAIDALGIMVWLIPVFAAVIIFTVDRGLVPLKKLSNELRQRDAHQLTPIDNTHSPSELAPLISALNELLARLDAAISREKRFTADASHELRTPLSAIRLHTQLAMKADNRQEVKESLEKVIRAVDQSTHLVEQLLLLTRLSPESGEISRESVDVGELCQSLLSELSASAQEKDIQLDFQQTPAGPLRLKANAQLLNIILRNLLDNAIRYTNAGGRIEVRLSQDHGQTRISVEDNGPGIPASQLGQVTERFFRLAGQEVEGCGLGLSIASQAVERLGASLELGRRSDGQSGLLACLVLGNT